MIVAQKLIWYDLIGGIYLEILANSFFPRSEESEMRKSNKSLEQKQEKMIAFFSCEPQEESNGDYNKSKQENKKHNNPNYKHKKTQRCNRRSN